MDQYTWGIWEYYSFRNLGVLTRITICRAGRGPCLSSFLLYRIGIQGFGNIEEGNFIALVHHLIFTYLSYPDNHVSYLRISNICVLKKKVYGFWIRKREKGGANKVCFSTGGRQAPPHSIMYPCRLCGGPGTPSFCTSRYVGRMKEMFD